MILRFCPRFACYSPTIVTMPNCAAFTPQKKLQKYDPAECETSIMGIAPIFSSRCSDPVSLENSNPGPVQGQPSLQSHQRGDKASCRGDGHRLRFGRFPQHRLEQSGEPRQSLIGAFFRRLRCLLARLFRTDSQCSTFFVRHRPKQRRSTFPSCLGCAPGFS